MPVDEFGLEVPREKHFLDLMMACLKNPHGFDLQLGQPKPSPHDGRCVIYLTGHDARGRRYVAPYYFRIPRDVRERARVGGSQRPSVEFLESLQRGIDARAEEARETLCRHYAKHAVKSP
jgi:hypothetical protein